ncbi:hypothetical protein SAMN04490240_0734 [Rhodococcus pyridinivorans]|uniref:hypothetical protein n=1 Tax=Rhodococcus pyridinivorans TaxID=103816 RepID=UPI0007CD7DC9|nr:hypothetical protein [Rhodococcus pyridinivorans]KLL95925.1 membrane protein [Rhodococcus sp. IITR03]SEB91594.1 hypothetical protein SAMN04490240_0734 [Rhodococcus pyridinivorans]
MTFFGRPGGPARMVLAIAAVGVLGLLTFVIFNLNTRLDNQQDVNLTSVAVSEDIVAVNDKLTGELQQLTELTNTARQALDATAALEPLLIRLDEAIGPAAHMLAQSTDGAQVTNEQLVTIQSILGEVQGTVLPLVESARAFGGQGTELLDIVQGLVADLRSSVESVHTINQMLPLPG